MLLAQEEALEEEYGLIARVNKNAEAKRELTVAGRKGKQFEKCAKEAMKLIKSNYAKGILHRSDDPFRVGGPKSKKRKKTLQKGLEDFWKSYYKTQQSPPPGLPGAASPQMQQWQGYPSSSWGPNPQMQQVPYPMIFQPPPCGWGPSVPGLSSGFASPPPKNPLLPKDHKAKMGGGGGNAEKAASRKPWSKEVAKLQSEVATEKEKEEKNQFMSEGGEISDVTDSDATDGSVNERTVIAFRDGAKGGRSIEKLNKLAEKGNDIGLLAGKTFS